MNKDSDLLTLPGNVNIQTHRVFKMMCELPDEHKMMFAINWRIPHTLFNVASKLFPNEDLQNIDWFAIYNHRSLGRWENGNKVNVGDFRC